MRLGGWECREQALELLRRGWPPGDEPRYDPDHALVLCQLAGYRPGLALLYEAKRLFREVLRVRAAARPLVGWAVGCGCGRDLSSATCDRRTYLAAKLCLLICG